MLNVTEATKNAYKNFGSTKELSIVIIKDGNTITLDNTKIVSQSLSLQETLEASENLTFIGCNASVLKFSCRDISDNIKGGNISVSVVADNTETIPLFTGIIDSVSNHSHEQVTMDIIAYDKLYKINNIDYKDWYDALNLPITLKNFRDSFFNYIGITQETVTLPNDNIQMTIKTEDETMPGKAILSKICQLNGRFGRIGRNGKFQYVSLQEGSMLYPSATLYPSSNLFPGLINSGDNIDKAYYTKIDFENYNVSKIDRVQFIDENGEVKAYYGASTAINIFTIQTNEFLYDKTVAQLETIGHNLLQEIDGLIFTPLLNLDLAGLPYIECGDLISVTTKRSSIATYVLKRTLSGVQALMDSYEANIEQYQPIFQPNTDTKIREALQIAKEEASNMISEYDLAVQMMNNLAINAMGAYQNYEETPQGGRIYYLSNMPIVKRQDGHCVFDSNSYVFMISGSGFFVSTDGGQTWHNGYDPQSGALVVNVLYAIGIHAEWIKTGQLTVGGSTSGTANPYIVVQDVNNNTICTINSNGIIMGKGYIASSDYQDTTPVSPYSQAGMKIDVNNKYVKSPYFGFDEQGAHLKGEIEATSGHIGAATITSDAITIRGRLTIFEGEGEFKLYPYDYKLHENFHLWFARRSGTGTTLVTVSYSGTGQGTTYNITDDDPFVSVDEYDYDVGSPPDRDYYLIEVSNGTVEIAINDYVLAYMGTQGFKGKLDGAFYGYLESDSGKLAGIPYTNTYANDTGEFEGDLRLIKELPNQNKNQIQITRGNNVTPPDIKRVYTVNGVEVTESAFTGGSGNYENQILWNSTAPQSGDGEATDVQFIGGANVQSADISGTATSLYYKDTLLGWTKLPFASFGNAPLTDGVSDLETGKFYFQYE